jgi:hypothetical protein
MIKSLPRIGLGTIAAWTMILLPLARGNEEDAATSLYGRGVHAYFAGRAGEAEHLLSRALGFEPSDPRVFYFRSLSRLRLGRRDEACSDMAVGAALESEQANRFAIGAALQRVQGRDRLLLEQYRRQAREQVSQVSHLMEGQRQQRTTAQDTSVLRQRVVVPLDEYLRAGVPRTIEPGELGRPAVAPGAVRPSRPAAVVTEPMPAARTEKPFQARETSLQPAPGATEPPVEAPPEADEDPFRDF